MATKVLGDSEYAWCGYDACPASSRGTTCEYHYHEAINLEAEQAALAAEEAAEENNNG